MLLKADHHRKDKQENICRSKPPYRVWPRYVGWIMHEYCMIFTIIYTLKV
jgi:hypothetical protein